MELLQQRLLWNVLPTGVVVAILYLAVWGEKGIVTQHQLTANLVKTEHHLDVTRTANAGLEREIARLRDDPNAQARAVAEDLLLVPAHSAVYRFVEGTP